MYRFSNKQGISRPLIIGIIVIILIFAAVVWKTQTPSIDQALTTKGAVQEKNTNEGLIQKTGSESDNLNAKSIASEGTEAAETAERQAAEKLAANAGTQNDSTAMPVSTQARYVDYSADAFAAAVNKKRVYFFHAKWCPTCKAANLDFIANVDKIPSDVILFKTDYDTEVALKTKYGVTYQHTFVQVNADGKAITKWNGGSFEDLLKNIK